MIDITEVIEEKKSGWLLQPQWHLQFYKNENMSQAHKVTYPSALGEKGVEQMDMLTRNYR